MKIETAVQSRDVGLLSRVKVVIRLRILVCLLAVFSFCAPSNAQELQHSQEFQTEIQDWKRGSSAVSLMGNDHVVVANLENPQLQLKWAIVSGDINESVDRVRARFLLNNETRIGLFYRKNAYGGYEQSVTFVHMKKSKTLENDEPVLERTIRSADLRIAEWDHDKLIVRYSDENGEQKLPTYFRFDLSRSPNP